MSFEILRHRLLIDGAGGSVGDGTPSGGGFDWAKPPEGEAVFIQPQGKPTRAIVTQTVGGPRSYYANDPFTGQPVEYTQVATTLVKRPIKTTIYENDPDRPFNSRVAASESDVPGVNARDSFGPEKPGSNPPKGELPRRENPVSQFRLVFEVDSINPFLGDVTRFLIANTSQLSALIANALTQFTGLSIDNVKTQDKRVIIIVTEHSPLGIGVAFVVIGVLLILGLVTVRYIIQDITHNETIKAENVTQQKILDSVNQAHERGAISDADYSKILSDLANAQKDAAKNLKSDEGGFGDLFGTISGIIPIILIIALLGVIPRGHN